MQTECPRCDFLVTIQMVRSKCNAQEFDAQCSHCGLEFSGALTFVSTDLEETQTEDSRRLSPVSGLHRLSLSKGGCQEVS